MSSGQDAHERRRVAASPETWPALRADGRRECPVCHDVGKAGGSELPHDAHFQNGYRRWCPGGPMPTDADKRRRMGQRWGRFVPGGLPGLGKR